jgi:predicted ribosomally synthesized peptide with SipW-like signal peptide
MNNKKKLWLSITVVAAVIALGVAGTYAYFTAIRTASTNRFTMGTLDLSVTDAADKVNEPFVIDNMGTDGRISGSKTWTIRNTGSLPGRLLVNLRNLKNFEGDCNDQEKAMEPACDPNTETGELGEKITLLMSLDGADRVSGLLTTVNQSKFGTDWNALENALITIPAGGTKTVTFHWDTPETGYGNEIQGDSLSFDTNFRLIQQLEGATPTN